MTLFVSFLDDMLRNHFNEYGKITDIRIFPAKNYAFIRLVDLSVSRYYSDEEYFQDSSKVFVFTTFFC